VVLRAHSTRARVEDRPPMADVLTGNHRGGLPICPLFTPPNPEVRLSTTRDASPPNSTGLEGVSPASLLAHPFRSRLCSS
jgi:hypothetical protein